MSYLDRDYPGRGVSLISTMLLADKLWIEATTETIDRFMKRSKRLSVTEHDIRHDPDFLPRKTRCFLDAVLFNRTSSRAKIELTLNSRSMEAILCVETNIAVSCPGNLVQSEVSVCCTLASLPSALQGKVVGRHWAVSCDCYGVRASDSGVLPESWTDC